jgi:hypothetical protein
VIVACAASPASTARPASPVPPKVALFGDSLAWEAQKYFSSLVLASRGTSVSYDARGTAVCDWLSQMRAVEAQFAPDEVELEFSGNALTPCMKGYEGGSPAYFAKYRDDTLTAIGIFRRGGARVVLIGAPISRSQHASDPAWDRLNQQYAGIAWSDPHHVTYVDAGSAVERTDGGYAQTLPCLPAEPCLGPLLDGVRSNVVRAPDGVHFCPVEKAAAVGIIGPCPVYSSGAYRYARAMVAALSGLPGTHGSMAPCPPARVPCPSGTLFPVTPATS